MKTKGMLLLLPALILFSCKGPIYLKGRPLLTGEEIRVLTADISQTQFSDIPVPGDFELQSKGLESYGTQVGSFRQGHLVYQGTTLPSEVENYLEKRMPEHGWKLDRREEGASGERTLVYVKGDCSAKYRASTVRAAEALPASYSTNPPSGPGARTFFTKLLIEVQTGKGS